MLCCHLCVAARRKTETHKRTRALTESMIHIESAPNALPLALLICAIVGCGTADVDHGDPQQYLCDQRDGGVPGIHIAIPINGETAPAVAAQYVHIHGRVTGAASANATASLFPSRNVSLAAALHTVTTEQPIQHVNLDDGQTFTFAPAPAGCYIVAVSGQAFGRAQGFPVINETWDPHSEIEMFYHGGDIRHSIAAFVIRPRQDSVGATDQIGSGGAK